MAIFIVNDSMCKEASASACFDKLFDTYGTPVSCTTSEDILNKRTRLKFDIPGIGELDEVSIEFGVSVDGTVKMGKPVVVMKYSDKPYRLDMPSKKKI